jgi:hypothetical protein
MQRMLDGNNISIPIDKNIHFIKKSSCYISFSMKDDSSSRIILCESSETPEKSGTPIILRETM